MDNCNTTLFASSSENSAASISPCAFSKDTGYLFKKEKSQYEEEKWEEWFEYWNIEKQKIQKLRSGQTDPEGLLQPDTATLPYDWWLYNKKEEYYQQNMDTLTKKKLTTFPYNKNTSCIIQDDDIDHIYLIWEQFEPKPHVDPCSIVTEYDSVQQCRPNQDTTQIPNNPEITNPDKTSPLNFILHQCPVGLHPVVYALGITVVLFSAASYVKF